jgi:hypothetical protein
VSFFAVKKSDERVSLSSASIKKELLLENDPIFQNTCALFVYQFVSVFRRMVQPQATEMLFFSTTMWYYSMHVILIISQLYIDILYEGVACESLRWKISESLQDRISEETKDFPMMDF